MTVIHLSTRSAPRVAGPASPVLPGTDPTRRGADLAGILDELVDAIDVRESFDPESAAWDTAAVIRRLERDLARAWTASRRAAPHTRGARRWPQ